MRVSISYKSEVKDNVPVSLDCSFIVIDETIFLLNGTHRSRVTLTISDTSSIAREIIKPPESLQRHELFGP
jgi:hypothetical protein